MPSVLTLLLSAAAVVATLPPPPWLWPVDGPHVVARPYSAPPSPYGRGHRGADLTAHEGAAVRAPAGGVVHFAGFVVDRPVLSIRHDDGVLSSFEPVESDLERGDLVDAGDVIGTLLPGHCDVPCLHVGARVLGQYVSPLRYLGGIPRSVLLPTRRSEHGRPGP
ncbi:M23 family metallopeptidase [Lysobacter korlensis]|uniref:M23 family metallopeptidase n=1 Tax=Lysobacter korlensis TaxID=553636 RepID=A0ABV6RNN7_9GAMM